MRIAAVLMTLALLFAGCGIAPARVSESTVSDATDPFAVVAEAHRLAKQDLWPGFDPQKIPVAIYDGERTLLFGHASPPEGFQRVPEREDVWVYPGRHPAVTANTSVELGGVAAATLMPPTTAVTLRSRAALLLHETFHVFQRARHPTWSANEVDLFTYPVANAELLTLRRSETEALRRALVSSAAAQTECWTRAALELRQQRFAAMPAGSAAYERLTEFNEGLATYVERRATKESGATLMPPEGFAPEAIRQRGYRTGVALAQLLDKFSPSWRIALEQNDTIPLDVLLSSALVTRAPGAACTFTPAEREAFQAAAELDIRTLQARRAEQRRVFLEQPGWRVLISAPGEPLFPQGFDPLNVQAVAQGEVLHTRFVKLGNKAGEIEVLGRPALTEASGEHPLFNGVRTLTLAGFTSEPVITEENGVVKIQAEGISARLRGAKVERSEKTNTIRIMLTL